MNPFIRQPQICQLPKGSSILYTRDQEILYNQDIWK